MNGEKFNLSVLNNFLEKILGFHMKKEEIRMRYMRSIRRIKKKIEWKEWNWWIIPRYYISKFNGSSLNDY